MKVIGIDPGIDGGICVLDKSGAIIEMHIMPTYSVTTAKKLKSGKYKKERHIDSYALADILYRHKDASICMERINTFAGQGASAGSKMIRGYGRIEGVMGSMGFKWENPTPGTWTKKIWIDEDKVYRDKVDARTRQGKIDPKPTNLNASKRIFPDANFIPEKKRTPHDGLFDSALIAEYWRREQ